MNEAAVVSSLKQLILNNESTLCSGLTFQGLPKRIHQVTTTNLTEATGYTFILVYCLAGDERSQPTAAGTSRQPSRRTTYPIRIEITDEGAYQRGEDQPYEQSHQDHRLFCDRLVDLIESQEWIGTAPKLMLERDQGRANDRAINKQNLSGSWEDVEGNWWATLHTQINFVLVDNCASTDGLY